MKLRNAISSWTILIPSLALNIALLAATVFFLKQLDFYYAQATAPAIVLNAGKQHAPENAARLAVRVPEPPAGSVRSASMPFQ